MQKTNVGSQFSKITLLIFLITLTHSQKVFAGFYKLDDSSKHSSTGARLYDEILTQSKSGEEKSPSRHYFDQLKTALAEYQVSEEQVIQLLLSMNEDFRNSEITERLHGTETLVPYEKIRDLVVAHFKRLKKLESECKVGPTIPEMAPFLMKLRTNTLSIWDWQKLQKLAQPSKDFSERAPLELDHAARQLHISPNSLTRLFPGANFYSFINRVGNYKDVILMVGKDGKETILKLEKNPEYPLQYEKLREKEKRPNVVFHKLLPTETDSLGTLAQIDYMGTERINWANDNHIQQVAQMGVAFSREMDTFDPNAGNLVIHKGKLFYIDRDLSYSSSDSLLKNIIANLRHSFPADFPNGLVASSICKKVLEAYRIELLKPNQGILTRIQAEWEANRDKLIEEEILRLDKWYPFCGGTLHKDIPFLFDHLKR